MTEIGVIHMNAKIEVKTDKDPEQEKAVQDEEVPTEKNQKAKEKPLETMTKSELLEKIKEIQEESQKNHDLYLRSEAEIENIKKRT